MNELFSFQSLEGVEFTPVDEDLKNDDLLEWSMPVFCLHGRITMQSNIPACDHAYSVSLNAQPLFVKKTP